MLVFASVKLQLVINSCEESRAYWRLYEVKWFRIMVVARNIRSKAMGNHESDEIKFRLRKLSISKFNNVQYQNSIVKLYYKRQMWRHQWVILYCEVLTTEVDK
jgi:hypothetical protein